jgi:hypothetical protein
MVAIRFNKLTHPAKAAIALPYFYCSEFTTSKNCRQEVCLVMIEKSIVIQRGCMAKNIKGNRDGEGGRNDSYTIPGRGIVEREELVKEVEKGKHPDFSIYELDQEKFVRAKPDSSQTNNVNRD